MGQVGSSFVPLGRRRVGRCVGVLLIFGFLGICCVSSGFILSSSGFVDGYVDERATFELGLRGMHCGRR